MKDFWANFTAGPGEMATATWQIAVMLIGAFILGFLLRYLTSGRVSKYKTDNDELKGSNNRLRDELDALKKTPKVASLKGLQTDLDAAQSKNRQLEKDLLAVKSSAPKNDSDQTAEIDALKHTNDKLNQELEDCRKRGVAASANKSSVSGSPVVSTGKSTDSDDLTKIEGIGKKIQEHLNNGGIWNFEQLSKTKLSKLQQILDTAGPAYTMHDPGTWPEQSKLAQNGHWEKLEKWQSELKGGRKRKKH